MNEMRRNPACRTGRDAELKKYEVNPEVAIVILNWNGKAFLEKFLPSVIASTYNNKKVIVADNASTDDSVPFLRTMYPDIRIIQNPSNDGFAKGYNLALKEITADYYVLLNSDVEVTEHWIQPIVELMESDQSIAACQPKILSYNERTLFEYAGAAGGWVDDFGYPFMRGRIFDVCEKDMGQYDDARPCFWASGAAFFVRAQAFHKMGGFDEYFFAHQEEIDLCWRLQLAGYKIYCQPASVVYHVGGGTLPKGNSRKTFLNYRNNLIMMHKNMPVKEKFWKIPFRIALNEIAATKSLFNGDFGYFRAVIQSHFSYIKWIIAGKKHSTAIQPPAFITGWFNGSIVWEHFIKKRNTFSEIVDGK